MEILHFSFSLISRRLYINIFSRERVIVKKSDQYITPWIKIAKVHSYNGMKTYLYLPGFHFRHIFLFKIKDEWVENEEEKANRKRWEWETRGHRKFFFFSAQGLAVCYVLSCPYFLSERTGTASLQVSWVNCAVCLSPDKKAFKTTSK